jgi:chromosome segregation ATPase
MAEKHDTENVALLEAMEREFQHVIAEMSGDQSIERFRKQFQTLYDSLRQSHDNERTILQKCKELTSQLSVGMGYIKNSENLTRKDAQTIKMLANELEKAKTVMQSAQLKEERDRSKIEHLQQSLKNLKTIIKESDGVQSGRNMELQNLTKKTEDLLDARKQLELSCETLNVDRNRLNEELKSVKNGQSMQDTELKKLNQTKKETSERLERDKKRMQKNDEDIKKISSQIDSILKEQELIEKDIEEKNTKFSKKEDDIKTFEADIEEKNRVRDMITAKNAEIKDRITGLRESNQKIGNFVRTKEDEIRQESGKASNLAVTLTTLKRTKEAKISEIQKLMNTRDEARNMAIMITKQILDLQRDIEHTDKVGDKDQNLVDNLLRDQNSIRKNFLTIVRENENQQIELENKKNDCKEIVEEVKNSMGEVDDRKKKIVILEQQKEEHIKEAKLANKKYLQLSEEMKLKDNLVSEFQKKTQETAAKLSEQQQLYEAVRGDRNLYSKNLTETQDEIAEIKLRYKIVTHQISQLKEEIDAKDKALNLEYYKAKDAEKRYQKLKKEHEELKKKIEEKKQKITILKNEIGKLHFIMKESENNRLTLKNQYESVVSERDLHGTQLIRRNDELALIYEKIKMQQNTLAKGEADYRERVLDIEILDNTIRDLTRELTIYKSRASQLGEFYAEINTINKELIEEKLKVKGLSEELENPKNKYRWRNLEGTDCDTNELISKIESLQKRLIAKTEEVVAKDLMINTQDQTIKNLEQVMSRQPGIEEAQQISYYQQAIKARTRKLKSLAAELNMYQAQSNEYKFEIERLTAEVDSVKKTLYDIRRREQLMLEQERRERRDLEEQMPQENIQML